MKRALRDAPQDFLRLPFEARIAHQFFERAFAYVKLALRDNAEVTDAKILRRLKRAINSKVQYLRRNQARRNEDQRQARARMLTMVSK